MGTAVSAQAHVGGADVKAAPAAVPELKPSSRESLGVAQRPAALADADEV